MLLQLKNSQHCEWFIDSKLSIHFGEDETKFLLFSKTKPTSKLNITNRNHNIVILEIIAYIKNICNLIGGEVCSVGLIVLPVSIFYSLTKNPPKTYDVRDSENKDLLNKGKITN